MSKLSAAVAPSARYAFVDALRGIAAAWVVVFHGYNKNLAPMTGYHLPQPFDAIFNAGYLGVYIFFVISGFVIMQSMRAAHVTPRFIGRFAIRRSLRLDPPYWVTIAAMIVLSMVSGRLQHDHAPLPLPTPGAVVAHLFYLQAFLGYPQIVGVFWTLCYEIQFYLVLAILTGLAQWKAAVLRSRWVLFAPLWLFAAACICNVAGLGDVTNALFVYGWPYFFLGVVVNWVHNREQPATALLVVALATALLIPFGDPRVDAAPKAITALVTAGAIYAVSLRGQLASLTLGRVLQYLGRISYSLYLVHMLVGTPLVRFGLRHLPGNGKGFGPAMILIALALAVSIAAAHVLYVLVERPAVRWSHRFVSR
jgi:peptidoglycan/LPS O-acetylase OafA/YrhL